MVVNEYGTGCTACSASWSYIDVVQGLHECLYAPAVTLASKSLNCQKKTCTDSKAELSFSRNSTDGSLLAQQVYSVKHHCSSSELFLIRIDGGSRIAGVQKLDLTRAKGQRLQRSNLGCEGLQPSQVGSGGVRACLVAIGGFDGLLVRIFGSHAC